MLRSLKRLLRQTPLVTVGLAVHDCLTNPRDFWELQQDILRTRHATRFLRPVHAMASGRKVMFLEMARLVMTYKQHGLLAAGVALNGGRACALTTRIVPYAKRYFRAQGVREVHYWESYALHRADRRAAQQDAAQFRLDGATFAQIKEWRYRGAQIGTQLLSSLSRKLHEGAPNLSNPAVRQQLEAALGQALGFVRQAEKMLAAVQPDVLVVNEANYSFFGAVVDVAIARGIDVVQFCQPARDDALSLLRLNEKSRRMHPCSVSPGSLARYASLPWTGRCEQLLQEEFASRYGGKWFLQGRNQNAVRPVPPDILRRELNLHPERPVAVIFCPVLWDANLFYGEDLFDDFGDWLVKTVSAACRNDQIDWLVKLHPANVWKRAAEGLHGDLADLVILRERCGQLPKHVRILPADTTISTRSLFELADYAVTVRGTVGMEIACFGVPVITGGTGRYSGLGFTIDSTTQSEYLAKLAALTDQPRLTAEQVSRAKWHALLAFRARQWELRSLRCDFKRRITGLGPLDYNAHYVAKSVEDMLRLGDVAQWAGWALHSKDIDYLDPRSLDGVVEARTA